MKSHERELLEVVTNIYIDICNKCTAVKADPRDLDTLRSRLEHEGLSFLTITLPSFSSDFERCLAEGSVDPSFFRSFGKNGKIPSFLMGISGQVFDRATGRLHVYPSIEAIEGIRQFAGVFRKLLVDCHPKRVQKALDGYMQCEHDLKEPIPSDLEDSFLKVSDLLWGDSFSIDILDESLPKHGPGATRERISGNRKYVHRRWHERLEPYFPFLGTAYSERSYGSEEYNRISLVSPEQEEPVRVITVPKTLKGPRIIAIEPVCMQYTQQMLSTAIIRGIEKHPIAGGHVNFHDQQRNRSLALESSRTERFATLDLSSASDRVPAVLALRMFRRHPYLMGAVDACRTTTAELPDGTLVPLLKFASMGSALCFPIESMYFFTICMVILLEKHKLPVTWNSLMKVSSRVFVYGDDIIVPTDTAVAVAEGLTKFHCKVNISKSFWTGKFRESCGMDAYDGEEVTPTYVRRCAPSNRRSADALISWTSASNLFYKRGYWNTAHYLRRKVETILGSLPVVGDRSPCLGVVSYMGCPPAKARGRYQRQEVLGWVPKPIYRKDSIGGYAALTKCLLNLERFVSNDATARDSEHLSRTVRRDVVTLKRRWAPQQ